jgi:hypothetical protein
VAVRREMKEVELRRHAAHESDALTAEGVEAVLEIGCRLQGAYHLGVSTGAARSPDAGVFCGGAWPEPARGSNC